MTLIKLFDSVSFDFIQQTSNIFDFGDNLKKLINILLGNTKKDTKFKGVSVVNRHPTDQFNISRGCRQGGPIAVYLFVLCIEILTLTIKKSKVTPYKTLQNETQLNYTYADDLTLHLKYSRRNKNKTIKM